MKEWGCLFSESGFGDPTWEAHVIGGWRFTASKISLIFNLICSARFFIVLEFSVMKCPDALCFALRRFPVMDTNLGILHHPVSLYMHDDALLYSFLCR